MGIEFVNASVRDIGIFVAVNGTSTTGKTKSALRMARAICDLRGMPLAVCDTEGGRTSHYAEEFRFREYRMRAPFNPERFVEVVATAEETKHGAIVIDSFSSEWIDAGGILDAFDIELERRVAAAQQRNPTKFIDPKAYNMATWAVVKRPHKAMMAAFRQSRIPIFFCLRAEEKTKPRKDGTPEKCGWLPLQDERFIYEWTVSLTLAPETPGFPRYDLFDLQSKRPLFKMPEALKHLFPEGRYIDERAGIGLWEWANSGKSAWTAQQKTTQPPKDVPRQQHKLSLAEDPAARREAQKWTDVAIAEIRSKPEDAVRKMLASTHAKERLAALKERHLDYYEDIMRAVELRLGSVTT